MAAKGVRLPVSLLHTCAASKKPCSSWRSDSRHKVAVPWLVVTSRRLGARAELRACGFQDSAGAVRSATLSCDAAGGRCSSRACACLCVDLRRCQTWDQRSVCDCLVCVCVCMNKCASRQHPPPQCRQSVPQCGAHRVRLTHTSKPRQGRHHWRRWCQHRPCGRGAGRSRSR